MEKILRIRLAVVGAFALLPSLAHAQSASQGANAMALEAIAKSTQAAYAMAAQIATDEHALLTDQQEITKLKVQLTHAQIIETPAGKFTCNLDPNVALTTDDKGIPSIQALLPDSKPQPCQKSP